MALKATLNHILGWGALKGFQLVEVPKAYTYSIAYSDCGHDLQGFSSVIDNLLHIHVKLPTFLFHFN